ncbi:MAG: signal peptidase II [Actinomycetota bacterium]
MDRARRSGALWLFSAAGLVFLLDRLTKVWAEQRLATEPIEVIQGVLTFRFATNPGGAFSLGQNAPWFFATASIVVSILIIVTAFRHTNVVTAMALGLVLGGALGNLTDRLTRGDRFFSGRVVDFIDLQIWPVFNIADAAIVVGAVILAVSSFVGDRSEAKAGAPLGGAASPAPSDGPAVDER